MKLVLLFGDTAVGKMTVGQSLAAITGLRLFHNHMAIEPVIEIFGELNRAAVDGIRRAVFEEFAKTDAYGMIFTYMWAFDARSDWDYIERVREIFTERNADTEFYYVELVAPQEVRLERNATANRLAHKPSKRDIERSNMRLIDDDTRYRCVSDPGEIPFQNYLRIYNAQLSPDAAAGMIKRHFEL